MTRKIQDRCSSMPCKQAFCTFNQTNDLLLYKTPGTQQ